MWCTDPVRSKSLSGTYSAWSEPSFPSLDILLFPHPPPPLHHLQTFPHPVALCRSSYSHRFTQPSSVFEFWPLIRPAPFPAVASSLCPLFRSTLVSKQPLTSLPPRHRQQHTAAAFYCAPLRKTSHCSNLIYSELLDYKAWTGIPTITSLPH